MSSAKTHKPPPIFVYGVVNYQKMIQNLRDIVKDDQYWTKSFANNTIKINCKITGFLTGRYHKIILSEKNS